MVGFERLSPTITRNEKYKRIRKRNKGTFWMTVQRVVKECAKRFPELDVDVTLQNLLDVDWESYEGAWDFLRSFDVEVVSPILYACVEEEEKQKEAMVMEEEAEDEERHLRRLERAKELIKDWIEQEKEGFVEGVMETVRHLITEYPKEVLELYEDELTMKEAGYESDYKIAEGEYGFPVIDFYNKYGGDIITFLHMKDTPSEISSERKKLQRELKKLKEKEPVAPVRVAESQIERTDRYLEAKIEELKKEIKKAEERLMREIKKKEKVPPVMITQGLKEYETMGFEEEKEEIVIECERFSGKILCLNEEQSKKFNKTRKLPSFSYYIGRVTDIEKEEGILENYVITTESGRKYVLLKEVTTNIFGDLKETWCIYDPSIKGYPYVYVNDWTIRELTAAMYGYADKGKVTYVAECIYSAIEDDYTREMIEKAYGISLRSYAEIMRIDYVIERELTEFRGQHTPTEIEFMMFFANKYREELAKCVNMPVIEEGFGGLGV